MKNIIISYILTTIVFLFIDLVWLGFIAKDLYRKYLGSFLSENVNWTAAIIFYLLYIVGISIFAIYPAVNKDSVFNAIILGGLFGFFCLRHLRFNKSCNIKRLAADNCFH